MSLQRKRRADRRGCAKLAKAKQFGRAVSPPERAICLKVHANCTHPADCPRSLGLAAKRPCVGTRCEGNNIKPPTLDANERSNHRPLPTRFGNAMPVAPVWLANRPTIAYENEWLRQSAVDPRPTATAPPTTERSTMTRADNHRLPEVPRLLLMMVVVGFCATSTPGVSVAGEVSDREPRRTVCVRPSPCIRKTRATSCFAAGRWC